MKYKEFEALLEEVKTKFTPGVKFDNHNIGGDQVHTVTTKDGFAKMGDDIIVLCVNGMVGYGSTIRVHKNNEDALIIKDELENTDNDVLNNSDYDSLYSKVENLRSRLSDRISQLKRHSVEYIESGDEDNSMLSNIKANTLSVVLTNIDEILND